MGCSVLVWRLPVSSGPDLGTNTWQALLVKTCLFQKSFIFSFISIYSTLIYSNGLDWYITVDFFSHKPKIPWAVGPSVDFTLDSHRGKILTALSHRLNP